MLRQFPILKKLSVFNQKISMIFQNEVTIRIIMKINQSLNDPSKKKKLYPQLLEFCENLYLD